MTQRPPIREAQATTVLVDHQPGNATRYRLYAVKLPEELTDSFMHSRPIWLCSFPDRGVSMLVQEDTPLHAGYVADKLKAKIEDAVELANAIGRAVPNVRAYPKELK